VGDGYIQAVHLSLTSSQVDGGSSSMRTTADQDLTVMLEYSCNARCVCCLLDKVPSSDQLSQPTAEEKRYSIRPRSRRTSPIAF